MILFYMALETIEDEGEKQIIANIFEKYSRYVKNLVLKRFDTLKDDADDVVQNVFILVIKYRKIFLTASDNLIKTLLYRYTVSVSINMIKKYKYETVKDDPYEGFEIADDVNIELDYITKEQVEIAKNIIKQLPPEPSNIIMLRYVDGLRNKEIAKIVGLSEVRVAVIIQRTLQKIRKVLENPETSSN